VKEKQLLGMLAAKMTHERQHHSFNRVLNSIGMSTAKRKSGEIVMEGIKSRVEYENI
jgi:hypothetical protein